ncbi:hypothetical protein FZC75_06945 [Sutcliffiella horikoshii]|uniref:Uncharacterized protein n=1 Tax=Sutcliffiella horikoshii TaxID=79883 RepID=A0A5D4TFE8_9BACI|nr:hypothetical protein FZC75_06945 [Sutcliffiella horikoshii]
MVNFTVLFGQLKNWFGHLSENSGQLHKIFGQLFKNFGQNQQIFGHLPSLPTLPTLNQPNLPTKTPYIYKKSTLSRCLTPF